MAEQSTVEGQQEAVKEAVLDGQEGNETPGNLEPENGEEKFQNLESSLADDEGLQAALNESGDGPTEEFVDQIKDFVEAQKEPSEFVYNGAEFAKAEEPKGILVAHIADPNPPSFSGGKMAPVVIYEGGAEATEPQAPCGGVPMGGELAGITADKKYAIGVDYSSGKDNGVLAVMKIGVSGKPDELVGTWEAIALGLQPDGSTKVVVSIQEGYWEAVKDWAEADGVPVERWLSDRLYEYISTYGEPAKGR